MFASLLLLLLFAQAVAPAASVDATPVLVEPDPSSMTPKEIKAFNENVPRSHPFYIRCVTTTDTGSLVRSTRTCHTNQQWTVVERRANDDARQNYNNIPYSNGAAGH